MVDLANGFHSLHRYDEALTLRKETLELFKAKYGPDDPGALMVLHNIGANFRALGRYAEALRCDEETRARRTAALGADHPDTLTCLWSIAQDLIKLDRGADAVALLDECLRRAVGKYVHRNFPEVADHRLRLFEKANDPQGCRTTAELWEKQERTDAKSLYQAAVCRAVTAAVLMKSTRAGPGALRLAKDDTDRAMAWLNKALAAGYRDLAEITTSKDLDILRDRADFKMVLADLQNEQAKSKPQT
jgi:tetratricopeptide (TPR) repeat protein